MYWPPRRSYGFNRSEFIRVLFDAYLMVVADVIRDRNREERVDPNTTVPDFFPELFPHRKEEAHQWLFDYLRLVIRTYNERKEVKQQTGSVDVDNVWDSVPEPFSAQTVKPELP